MDAERLIGELSRRQHGVMARRQLTARGLGARQVERRLTSGQLIAIHRGVYRIGAVALGRPGRWLAAVLAAGETAVLSHRSAAHLWGLVDQSGLPQVTRESGGVIPLAGVELHRTRRLPSAETSVRDRIPVTSVSRTLVDLAATLETRALTAAFNEARRLRVFDLEAMRVAIAAHRTQKGIAKLRRLVERVDPARLPSKSELEEMFRGREP